MGLALLLCCCSPKARAYKATVSGFRGGEPEHGG